MRFDFTYTQGSGTHNLALVLEFAQLIRDDPSKLTVDHINTRLETTTGGRFNKHVTDLGNWLIDSINGGGMEGPNVFRSSKAWPCKKGFDNKTIYYEALFRREDGQVKADYVFGLYD